MSFFGQGLDFKQGRGRLEPHQISPTESYNFIRAIVEFTSQRWVIFRSNSSTSQSRSFPSLVLKSVVPSKGLRRTIV